MKRLLLAMIRFYRRYISPNKPPCCRYIPTCSQYAIEAIEIDGAVLGERGDERRNDAGETSIHMRFSFRLP